MSTWRIALSVVLLLVGTGAVFFRNAWTEALGEALGWSEASATRNGWLATAGLVLPCLVGVLLLTLGGRGVEREIVVLARALEVSHLTDLEAMPERSLGAKKLTEIAATTSPGEVERLVELWSPDLADTSTSVRTSATYRLWACLWLLRELDAGGADDLAERLWFDGEFLDDHIADRVRTEEQLLAALEGENPDERWHAARILATLRVADAAGPLTVALKDEDARVREHAAIGLAAITATEATEELVKLLSDPETPVRATAAEALGRLGAMGAVDSLTSMYGGEKDWQVRAAMIKALGRIGSEHVAATLVRALGDPQKGVRETAVDALKRLGLDGVSAMDEALRTTMNPHVKAGINEVVAALRLRAGLGAKP